MNPETFAILAFAAGTLAFVWFSDSALGWIAHLALVRRDTLRAIRAAAARKRASSHAYWLKRLGLGGYAAPRPPRPAPVPIDRAELAAAREKP